MTFEHYGIHDGDSIIVLPREVSSSISRVNLWLSLTRGDSIFNDCVRSIVDPATSGEAARLRDLHMTRIERRPRAFMKICTQCLQGEADGRSRLATVIPEPSPISPSTNALPIVWTANDPTIRIEDKKEG
jgi:hypothetical protein